MSHTVMLQEDEAKHLSVSVASHIQAVIAAQNDLYYCLESSIKQSSLTMGRELVRLEAMRALRFLSPEQQDSIRRLLQD